MLYNAGGFVLVSEEGPHVRTVSSAANASSFFAGCLVSTSGLLRCVCWWQWWKRVGHLEMICYAEELCRDMRLAGAEVVGESGMVINPFTGHWSMSRDTAVNYIMSFKKSSLTREHH